MKWKPIYTRRLLVWSGWGLVLLVGLAALATWNSADSYENAIQAFEEQIGSSKHDEYVRDTNRSQVGDEDNMAIALIEAVSEVEERLRRSQILEPAAWSPAMAAEARAYVARHLETLEKLEKAATLPGCSWPPTTEVDLDVAPAARIAALLLRAQGLVAVANRNDPRVEVALRSLREITECLYTQPHLLGAMIALVAERSWLEVAHAAAASPATSAGLLERLGAELTKSARVDRVKWALAAEGALALSRIEEGELETSSFRLPFLPPLSRRVSTALALRWVEFDTWSRQPLEVLLRPRGPRPKVGLSMAGLVADAAVHSMRLGVVSLGPIGSW